MNQYENRYKPKWYHTGLFIFFATCCVYAVLVSNPYLYSGKTFSQGLTGEKIEREFAVPMNNISESSFEKIALPEPPQYLNWSRSSVENSGETRDRRYRESETRTIELEPSSSTPSSWVWLEKELVVLDKSGLASGHSMDGKKQWSLKLIENQNEGPFFPHPISDGRVIYFVHRKGRILAFDKQQRNLLWSLKKNVEYLSDGFLFKNNLFVLGRVLEASKDRKEPKIAVRIFKYDRRNGELLNESSRFDASSQAEISFSIENQILFLASAERLLAVQLPELKVKWQKVLSSAIEGPPVVATKDVLVSLKEGKVKGFNMTSGKESWEEDLQSALQGQPTYIPIYNRVVAITKNGYLHVIDINKGDRIWRFKLDNQNELKIPWSTRLSGKFIEELSMRWKYQGWTIWSPCVSNRICIYNPEQGQIVGRVMLSGSLITQPMFSKNSFKVVLRSEDGAYKIATYTERGGAVTPRPKPTPKLREPEG